MAFNPKRENLVKEESIVKLKGLVSKYIGVTTIVCESESGLEYVSKVVVLTGSATKTSCVITVLQERPLTVKLDQVQYRFRGSETEENR